MAFELRPYQREAVESVIAHVKKRTSACLIELATGAGKSLIVAELACFFAKVAPTKRVLCIAPSKELVEQNAEKYESYGFQASIFCASAGSKCLRNQVIFASPQTALKQIEKIAHLGVSAIIVDEAHGITPTMRNLIDSVREYKIRDKVINEKVRVIGMTATPYRMGTGYIYAADYTQEPAIHHDEDKAIDPYYSRLLYRVTAGSLVEQGFLSEVLVGDTGGDSYDTSGLKVDSMGKFTSASVNQTFNGNSKTERIVNKVVAQSENRMGVMFFGATISHAEEIASYLPEGEAHVITGKTSKKERAQKIASFKARKFKYLVNVDVLTTGFDAPHVDVVAILRATESASLYQQIIGRGLRLHPEKNEVLVLDYAENIKRHGLESDIFTPNIKAKKIGDKSQEIEVICPACGCISMKKRRSSPEFAGLAHDAFGNFIVAGTQVPSKWADGQPIEWTGTPLMIEIKNPMEVDEFGCHTTISMPMPAHYSRRCSNIEAYLQDGAPVPCGHRYAYKLCYHCGAENDIAARHCSECKERLIDPNEKLTEVAGRASYLSDGETREIYCESAKYEPHVSMAGKHSIKASYKTEIGKITAWHSINQFWIFSRIAFANGAEPTLVSDDYHECEGWTVAPKAIKVKKVVKNGLTKFEVKEVLF